MGDRYRNVGGPHTASDGTKVGQGETFEPTERELESFGDKLEPVEDSGPTRGADIGLRGLEWGSEAALNKALDAEPTVTVQEMRDVGATGSTGFVTSDVERALDAREP